MRFVKWLAAVAFAAALPCAALAQTSPNLTKGQVLTAGQWNALFSGKQDTLGFTPLNVAGGVMTGRLVTAAPGAATSSLNLTPGSTPASPANGDLWLTPLGLFAQVNGVTIGPLSGGSSASFGNTSPVTLSFPSGVVTYACPTCGVTGSPLSQFAATTSAQLAGIVSDETGTGALVFGTAPTITLGNGTGLPIATGVSGLGAGVATFLATPSSTNFAAALTGETGTGAVVFGTGPAITGASVTGTTALGVRSTGSGAFDMTIANTENLTAGRALTVTLNDAARTLNLGGNLTTAGAASLPSIAQGDLWFGSAAGTITALAKNTSAIRYLSNTGTSNNPAWAQVDLSTGVTNTLALSSLTSGTQDTVVGYWSSAVPSALAINNCTGALTYSTTTHTFGCNATAGTGNVVNSGTPTANQISQWTNATTIQGVNLASLLTAGAGVSITGTTTPTIALSLTNTTLNASPANPTATTSATLAMMGLGSTCKITPTYSGKLAIIVTGNLSANTAGNLASYSGRYGTGAAPGNNTASSGSSFQGSSISLSFPTANQSLSFASAGDITGLTPGVQVWIDIATNNSGSNTTTMSNVNCAAHEY